MKINGKSVRYTGRQWRSIQSHTQKTKAQKQERRPSTKAAMPARSFTRSHHKMAHGLCQSIHQAGHDQWHTRIGITEKRLLAIAYITRTEGCTEQIYTGYYPKIWHPQPTAARSSAKTKNGKGSRKNKTRSIIKRGRVPRYKKTWLSYQKSLTRKKTDNQNLVF